MRLRERFDPLRSYVANKPFKWGKVKFNIGDRFPTEQVTCTDRKVRQLYEARYLRMQADNGVRLHELIQPPAVPTMPDFDRLSPEAIRNWLKNHCVEFSDEELAALETEALDHSKLVKIAQNQWNKRHNVVEEVKTDAEPMPDLPALPVIEPPKEETNGVAATNGTGEPSGDSVQRSVDDRDAETGDTDRPGRQRRSNRNNRHHVQRGRHQG